MWSGLIRLFPVGTQLPLCDSAHRYGTEEIHSNIFDRVLLAVVVLLYSVCLTCVVAEIFPRVLYIYRIMGQSFVDVLGARPRRAS